jgi:hypothetical protein
MRLPTEIISGTVPDEGFELFVENGGGTRCRQNGLHSLNITMMILCYDSPTLKF